LELQKNENVLIVTDERLRNIGHAQWQAVREQGNDVHMVEMTLLDGLVREPKIWFDDARS